MIAQDRPAQRKSSARERSYTLDNVDLTVSQDLSTISGTITWSYQGASKTCSGSTTITGTRGPT